MPGARGYVACCLWELAAKGLEETLDLVRGEIGADGIAILLNHPAHYWMVTTPDGKLRSGLTAGAFWFHPDLDLYRHTRLRPLTDPALKGRTLLRRLADACRDRGLALRIQISACHNPAIASRHPEAACCDALGTPNRRWLCPANPDVRELIRAIVRDATAQAAAESAVITSLAFPPPTGPGALDPDLPAGPVERFLINLCLCVECARQSADAGVDVEALHRLILVTLKNLLTTGHADPRTPADFVAAHPPLAEFMTWRSRLAARTRASLASTLSPGRILLPADSPTPPTPAPDEDPPIPRLLRCTPDSPPPENLPPRWEVQLPLGAGGFRQAPELVSAARLAAERGAAAITISGLGHWPAAWYEWARQAFRFAHRIAPPP